MHPFERLVDALAKRYECGLEGSDRKGPMPNVVVLTGGGASKPSGMRLWPQIGELLLELVTDCFTSPTDFYQEVWNKLSPVIGKPDVKLNEIDRPKPKVAGTDSVATESKPKTLWVMHPDNVAELARKLDEHNMIEAMLSVACQTETIGQKVREKLQELFQLPYSEPSKAGPPPQLLYELLAHFMKHEFIDHAITMNFDEVFDVALENELGKDGFDCVFSDQQVFPDLVEEGDDSFPIRRSRLIKVHGSISVPQSLRFTQWDTGALSRDLERLLTSTLFPDSGSNGPAVAGKSPTTSIISLGYSWHDRDLIQWILSRCASISNLFIVRNKKSVPALLEKLLRICIDRESKDNCQPGAAQSTVYSEFGTRIHVISSDELSAGDVPEGLDGKLKIDHIMWAVWSHLDEKTLKDFPLTPVSRHLLLSYRFMPELFTLAKIDRIVQGFGDDHTAQARFQTEASLHLVKCKGMINISVMADDARLHRYFRLMRSNQSWNDIIPKYFPTLIANDFSGFAETYFDKSKGSADFFQAITKNLSFPSETVSVYKPRFLNDEKGAKIKFVPEKEQESSKQFVGFHLNRIFESSETEVERISSPHASWLFRGPEPLPTFANLQETTKSLLKSADWHYLLLIAESGAWLMADVIRELLMERVQRRTATEQPRNDTILLIDASLDKLQGWELREEIEGNLLVARAKLTACGYRIARASIPWWRHNTHGTILCDQGGLPHDGIFFRRERKASRIQPVHVTHPDTEELWLAFMSYARRAAERKLGPNRLSVAKEEKPFFDAIHDLFSLREENFEHVPQMYKARFKEAKRVFMEARDDRTRSFDGNE